MIWPFRLKKSQEQPPPLFHPSTGWRVGRKGLNYIFEAPGRFAFAVPTAQAQAGGWAAAQSCDKRACFTSSAPPGNMTVYEDGRMYFGAEFRSLWRDLPDSAEQARQHAAPAEIAIPEPMGRSNRSTASRCAISAWPTTSTSSSIRSTRGAR